MTLLNAGQISCIRKSQIIHVNLSLNVGPWFTCFFFMDSIRCNALTLYVINHGKTLRKTNAFDNGWDLVISLVCKTRFLSYLGDILMRQLKLMIMLNIPSMAKESSGVIFVYSISLLWKKRKRRAHSKS